MSISKCPAHNVDLGEGDMCYVCEEAPLCRIKAAVAAVKDESGQGTILAPSMLADAYHVAVCAAMSLHEQAKPEGDLWDGPVWLERLESSADDSLAARLIRDVVTNQDSTAAQAVGEWLSERGL